MNSCPYYDVSDECYARLDAMIGTMNKQHEHFVSWMTECSLLHETTLVYLTLDLRLVSMMTVSLTFS